MYKVLAGITVILIAAFILIAYHSTHTKAYAAQLTQARISDSLRHVQLARVIDNIVHPLASDTDFVERRIFFHDSAIHNSTEREICYAYMAVDDSDKEYYLHFRVDYTGEHGLNFDKCKFRCGDSLYTIQPQHKQMQLAADGVHEWFDNIVTPDELKLLRAISKCTEVKMRYQNDETFSDRQLTPVEIAGIKNIVTRFQLIQDTTPALQYGR